MERERYWWIDTLRGAAILAMVIYHGAYDIISLYGVDSGIIYELFNSKLVSLILHPIFAGLFIYLCGLSSNLSQNNLKRGTLFLIYGIGLSIITGIGETFIPRSFILFGILHLMGVCVLGYSIFKKSLNRIPIKSGTILLIILAILSRNLAQGELGLWGKLSIGISTYRGGGIIGLILFIIGYPTSGYYSSDYFPLIPWSLIYISGTLMGKNLIKTNPASLSSAVKKVGIGNNFLSYVGKHTLWIYVLHQPILILVLSLIMGRLPG